MSEIQLTTFEKAIYRAVRTLGASAYGVTIAEEIERTTNKEVNLPIMHLALHHLEEHDILRAEWGARTPERGWKRRRYYYFGPRALDVVEQVYGPINPDMYKEIFEKEPEDVAGHLSKAPGPPLFERKGYVAVRKTRSGGHEWPDIQTFAPYISMCERFIRRQKLADANMDYMNPVQRIVRVSVKQIEEEENNETV